jgi:glucose/mannose-6-phosphate isomerase
MSDRLGPAALRTHDSGGMEGLVRAWPEQIRSQRAVLAQAPWPKLATPRLLAVGALGGSATAAELVRGLEDDRLPVPFLVVREYEWPAAVGTRHPLRSLLLFGQHRGDARPLRRRRSARSGPRRDSAPGARSRAALVPTESRMFSVPSGLPPRAALGYSLISLLALLPSLGFGR